MLRKPGIKPLSSQEDRYSVWVIEDNYEFRRQLVGLLNISDVFRCDADFGACEPSLKALEDSSPPDMVLLDIGLPGMSGIEGIRRIKSIAPSTEIVILTVFEDNENVVRAIAAGASGYLHKGSSIENVLESLEAILAGGAPINPHIARKVLAMFAALSAPKTDYGLTKREAEILHLLLDDPSQRQIGEALHISHHTVNMHLRNIYAKLQVQSKSGAIAKALKERLV
ncbi:MAG TPA: response regulator transcription factor [Bacteroidota bacterium]|jgi:DNA-binding NarL/FixJ family response regulator